jgi:hypothetical protein
MATASTAIPTPATSTVITTMIATVIENEGRDDDDYNQPAPTVPAPVVPAPILR